MCNIVKFWKNAPENVRDPFAFLDTAIAHKWILYVMGIPAIIFNMAYYSGQESVSLVNILIGMPLLTSFFYGAILTFFCLAQFIGGLIGYTAYKIAKLKMKVS